MMTRNDLGAMAHEHYEGAATGRDGGTQGVSKIAAVVHAPVRAAIDSQGELEQQARSHAADVERRPLDTIARLRWIRTLVRLGRAREACAVLSNGLELTPSSENLLAENASLLRKLGRLTGAKVAIETLEKHHPGHRRLSKLRGELAQAVGDFGLAMQIFAAEVAAYPKDERTRICWVRCLDRLGFQREAKTALVEGLAMAPISGDLLVEMVLQERRSGELTGAEAAFQTLAGCHSQHPRLLELRAKLSESMGDLEAAEAWYAADANAFPEDIVRRLHWVRCLAKQGRHETAQDVLAAGLKIAPDSPDLLVERAWQLRRTGRLADAEEALSTFQRFHPGHSRLEQLRGELLEALGRFGEAERAYAADLKAYPHDVDRRLHLARCLGRLGRPLDALAILSDGSSYNSTSAELFIEKVTQSRNARQFDTAESAMKLLETHYPAHPLLPRLRGELAMSRGDLDAACEMFAADAAAYPEDVARRMRWVKCLRASGRIDEALTHVADASPNLLIRQVRVECLLELGRWEEASELLDTWPDITEYEGRLPWLRLRMNLAIMRFDYACARDCAQELIKSAPNDTKITVGLVRSAVGLFMSDLAWRALSNVPNRSPDGGSSRQGVGKLRNLFGQIVNDLRLHPKETAALAAAAKRTDDQLIDTAAAHLRADPGNFGAALGLLTGLSRAGRLQSCPHRIPKLLHQFWDKDPPADVAQMMARNATMNSDCSYRRWDDPSARQFLSDLDTHCSMQISRAYRAARHVAMRADIFRLGLLYMEGGLWLDADDCCVAPLWEMVPEGAELVCYQEDIGSIGNNFLAARPRHPLIGAALCEASQAVIEGASESVWLVTGPGLLTRIIAKAIASNSDHSIPVGCHILPLQNFRTVVHAARGVSYKSDRRNWQRAAA